MIPRPLLPSERDLAAEYARQLLLPRSRGPDKPPGVAKTVRALARGLHAWPAHRLKDGADPWVWSDQHLGHANIIRYADRPYESVEEMDRAFFDAWEARVGDDDTVVFAGDLAMGPVIGEALFARIRALPGRKILIPGNHDVSRKGGTLKIRGFDAVHSALLAAGDPPLIFTHVPLVEVPEGFVNVHGHTHGRPPGETPHINVSVEQLDYAPVRLSALRALARELASGRYPAGSTTLERIRAVEGRSADPPASPPDP